MGTNECLRVGHSRYIESGLFYSNRKVGANELDGNKMFVKRAKKKFEPKYGGQPCRKVFAFHQTCVTPFALNHDINLMRTRSLARPGSTILWSIGFDDHHGLHLCE